MTTEKLKMMEYKTYLGIALRILIICTTGIALTYITPQLRDFFGDIKAPICPPRRVDYTGVKGIDCDNGEMDLGWIWGVRHYWYFWFCVSMFILSVFNLFGFIVKRIDKHIS